MHNLPTLQEYLYHSSKCIRKANLYQLETAHLKLTAHIRNDISDVQLES